MNMKRVHIVGSGPRTGTTLMFEVMVACCEFDHFCKHEDRIFIDPPEKGDIFLTKAPQDTLVVEPILKVDPGLYVICMIRDPRDAIVSKHGTEPDRYWASLRFWKAYIPFWRRFRHHPRCITVKYEDFVSDPDKIQRILANRMPFLKMKLPFSQYHEATKPSKLSMLALGSVRPIAPLGIGKWQKHLPRVAGQIQLHGSISEDLIELGYEKDDAWMKVLLGVEPDLEKSHWPEYFTKEDVARTKHGIGREIVKVLMRRSGINPLGVKRRISWITNRLK